MHFLPVNSFFFIIITQPNKPQITAVSCESSRQRNDLLLLRGRKGAVLITSVTSDINEPVQRFLFDLHLVPWSYTEPFYYTCNRRDLHPVRLVDMESLDISNMSAEVSVHSSQAWCQGDLSGSVSRVNWINNLQKQGLAFPFSPRGYEDQACLMASDTKVQNEIKRDYFDNLTRAKLL